MPANAIVPSSSEPERGNDADRHVPAERDADADDEDHLHDLEREDRRGLGDEQAAARERRRPEPFQHAVAALEAGRDPERHHRRRP